MSYEGYTQRICNEGHYRTHDCWGYPDTCDCGAKWKERNEVDQTNGCGGSPCYCGERELVELVPPVVEKCNLGHEHEITEGKYTFGKVETHVKNL